MQKITPEKILEDFEKRYETAVRANEYEPAGPYVILIKFGDISIYYDYIYKAVTTYNPARDESRKAAIETIERLTK